MKSIHRKCTLSNIASVFTFRRYSRYHVITSIFKVFFTLRFLEVTSMFSPRFLSSSEDRVSLCTFTYHVTGCLSNSITAFSFLCCLPFPYQTFKFNHVYLLLLRVIHSLFTTQLLKTYITALFNSNYLNCTPVLSLLNLYSVYFSLHCLICCFSHILILKSMLSVCLVSRTLKIIHLSLTGCFFFYLETRSFELPHSMFTLSYYPML